MNGQSLTSQFGQAMTEFNITAVAVLLPLFILIPLLGKYIDIKHTSVQTARNTTWERTVWHEGNLLDSSSTLAIKQNNSLTKDAITRTYAKADSNIRSSNQSFAMNPLWTDHSGTPLFDVGGDVKDNMGQSDVPSLGYKGITTTSNILQELVSPLDSVMNKVNGVFGTNVTISTMIGGPVQNLGNGTVDNTSDYNFNLDSYYRPVVTLTVPANDRVASLGIPDLTFTGKASLISDGWNSDVNRFERVVKSYVPLSQAGEQGIVEFVQGLAEYELPIIGWQLFPELGSNSLELGYVGTGPVKNNDAPVDCQYLVCR